MTVSDVTVIAPIESHVIFIIVYSVNKYISKLTPFLSYIFPTFNFLFAI